MTCTFARVRILAVDGASVRVGIVQSMPCARLAPYVGQSVVTSVANLAEAVRTGAVSLVTRFDDFMAGR